MLRIEIDIEHPVGVLVLLAIGVGTFASLQTFFGSQPSLSASVGGDGVVAAEQVYEAESEIEQLRREQAVLERREEILRFQFASLQSLYENSGTTWTDAQYKEYLDARNQLIALLQNKSEAESGIRRYLRQIWEAEGRAIAASSDAGTLRLSWPVEPSLGISATFKDPAYEKRFGIPHHGIDLPIEQGSTIHAAADGVVDVVSDNGLGFSYVIVRHAGGSTLYGHVSDFLVAEGDFVHRGDGIALSGGMPGTKGAGSLTTGPHLHFEVMVDGVRVDPEAYL